MKQDRSFNRPPQNTGYDSGTIIAVNNDDDDASETLDFNDSNMAVPDNDLVAYYPFGRFTGQCCPCPEHQIHYAETADLISASPNLAIYLDACKSNIFSGTVYAGQAIYVEGLSKSSSVGADNFIWQYEDDQTHTLTDIFTVLGQRIFGDLNFDGEIDVEDKALHTTLPREFGWIMPENANAFRKVQLQTDIGLPGVFTLSLSGTDTFRVWQSANPGTNDVPLFVSGQSVTNGINGISWGTSSTAGLYIQAVNGGSGILTYTFMGTGSADGIVSRASLKMTAFSVNIDGDYDRNGISKDHTDEAAPVFFTNTVGMVILPNNNDNTDDNIPNIDCADNIINGFADLPDIYPLSISRLGISADAISDGLTFELRVSGTGDDPAGAPVPKGRVRIFPSRTANAVGVIGPDALPESIVFAKNPSLNQLDISLLAGSGHLELGVEGIRHGMPVEVVFRALIDGEEVAEDAICVLNAPFLLSSNLDATTKLYLGTSWPEFSSDVEDFLAGFVPLADLGSTFIQDFAEIGYSYQQSGQTSHTRNVVFEFSEDRAWYGDLLLDGLGYGTLYDLAQCNPGGDIECTPPTSAFPFGRAVVGENLSQSRKAFLRLQKLQTNCGDLIELPVDWLYVGHADEVFTIVPTGDTYRVLVADLQLAIDLLRNNTNENTTGGFPSRSALLAEYDDPANAAKVSLITSQLSIVCTRLAQGLGIPESQIIRIPVTFTVDTAKARAYLPNMINMIVVCSSTGARRLAVPEPYFEPYTYYLSDSLSSVGYVAGEVETVDTTGLHANYGEAHCASISLRAAP